MGKIFGNTLVGQESRSELHEVLVVTVPNVDKVGAPGTFAENIGAALRDARRVRHMRIRHLADSSISAAQLKAAEKGELPLSRPLLTELSSRYGVDLGGLFSDRQVLRIEPTVMSIGDIQESFDAHSPDSILEAYLKLLDQVRADTTGAPGEPRPLRRNDIQILADHMKIPSTTVISRLAYLMESNRTETRAMVELYLAGASVVGLRSTHAS